MSAQAQAQAGFWFDQDEQDRFFARLKRTLVLSLVLHLVVLLMAAGLRIPQRGERPLASVEVSLVSLPTPTKRVEAQKPVEPAKPQEIKPAPPSSVKQATAVPTPAPSVKEAVAVPPPSPPVKEAISIPVLTPTAKTSTTAPTPAFIPARTSSAKDILKDLDLPPDAPKFGELTPAKAIAQPRTQVQSKFKVPDLPKFPDVTPEHAMKTPPQQASISEDLDRELAKELKKIQEFKPAAKLETPKEAPVKPAPLQEASVPVVSAPQTMLKTSGSSGTNPFWARVEAIIRSQWEPPPIDISGSSYSVIVKFRFYRNGTVKDVGIQHTSGNSYFDDAGRRAILKPRQFPQFPADMTEAYQDVEMVFRVGEVTG